jgi:DNA-binding HxlR family transcriptional regulator
LVAEGLVERYPSEAQPGRDAYRLTAKGRTLGPVLKALAKWGLTNIRGTAALLEPKL